MRPVLILTCMIVCIMPLMAEEDMPSSVQRAIASYERDVQRAQEAYDAALEEARGDLREEFEEEIERYTRRGDLDTALAIRERCNAILEGEDGEPTAEAPEETGPVRVRTPDGWTMVGRWNGQNPYWNRGITFNADGTFGRDGRPEGTWLLRYDGEDTSTIILEINWRRYAAEYLVMQNPNRFQSADTVISR